MTRATTAGLLGLLVGLCACNGDEAAPGSRQVIVLGLDGMDHGLVKRMLARGELPHLARLAREGGFAPLRTSVPPQSPTAWSNFITGKRPGHHGIFDFIQRDPATMEPYLSTSRAEPPSRVTIGSLALPLGGGSVELLRREKPFWWYLDRRGVPATVIRIPSHFPPRDDGDARVLSGMGTPDLLGTYGTFTLLTTSTEWLGSQLGGGLVVRLEPTGRDSFRAAIEGPPDPLSSDDDPLELPVEVALDASGRGAVVTLGGRTVVLGQGEWSPLIPVELQVVSHLYSVSGMVRLYLKQVKPDVVLYVSPLNIDPADPALPISSPPDFAAHLAREAGRFYTQGMAEDTKALATGVLTPDEFLHQAGLVLTQREKLLELALKELKAQRGGLLFFYFSSTDQISHMFYRALDRTHPARTAEDDPHADVIPRIYRRLDRVVGRVRERLGPDDLLLVMSDHGFGPAAYLFNLNGWLRHKGYLAARKEPGEGAMGQLDWPRTQAYGLGLNGLYLNLRGRERDGAVPPARREVLLQRLKRQLLAIRHPETGRRVVTSVARPDRLYPGPAVERAPDLIVGYGRGFKVSDASAQGLLDGPLYAVNRSEWSGDHCGDSRVVPGILFSSRPLRGGAHHLYDLPPAILAYLGVEAPAGFVGRSVLRRKR
jgi:predicted AlkP superfamily phosphohydrolase/phosphomutase